MKIKTKKSTTIISGAAFIILGIILLSIQKTLSYMLIGTGILIEMFGVIDEIRDVLKKDKE